MTGGLERLNRMARDESIAELMKCCGASRWAERVTDARPFNTVEELVQFSRGVWRGLTKDDWLEAFSHHPKIGGRKAAKAQSEQERKWSEQEQSSATRAPEYLLIELNELNRRYEERFGYIFIICATGKSTSEMLGLLKSRITNNPEAELLNAAEEQGKITELRLRRLLDT